MSVSYLQYLPKQAIFLKLDILQFLLCGVMKMSYYLVGV